MLTPAVAAATTTGAGQTTWAMRPKARVHLGKSLTLALLAHAALVVGLSVSVDWRTKDDAVFAAELWASVPRVAAAPAPLAVPPPAAPPAPTPTPPAVRPAAPPVAPPVERPPAQIAVEAEKPKPKPVPKLVEPKPDPPPKVTQKATPTPAPREPVKAPPKPDRTLEANDRAQETALAKQREENLKRMLGQMGGGAQGSSNTSTLPGADAAPSAAYTGRLRARIMPNVLVPQAVPLSAKVEVEVRVASDGQVISRRVLKASGSPEWDANVLRAIDRTRVLPRDTDGRVPPVLILSFTPQD